MISGSVWYDLAASGKQFLVFGAIIVTLLGLCIGSFINVVIYRLPRNESIVTGRSHCTLCGKEIAWYDLFPLVSYLLLGGRCRNCGAPISWRYPLVESMTAGLFLALYLHFGPTLTMVKYLFLAALLVAVSFIDLERFIIPNSLVLSGVIFGVGIIFFVHDISFWSALLGAASCSGLLLLVSLISRGGMGLGDIKLALVTGLFLGWPLGLAGLMIGVCLGGLLGIILLASKIKGRKDPVPFGPFIALGTLIAVPWGAQILHLVLGIAL
jgi:leader peptidase (prepilin peptidase)/N-methyltransferase